MIDLLALGLAKNSKNSISYYNSSWKVDKVFTNVSTMNAHAQDIDIIEGTIALVKTDDTHGINSIYVKTSTGWQFVCQITGDSNYYENMDIAQELYNQLGNKEELPFLMWQHGSLTYNETTGPEYSYTKDALVSQWCDFYGKEYLLRLPPHYHIKGYSRTMEITESGEVIESYAEAFSYGYDNNQQLTFFKAQNDVQYKLEFYLTSNSDVSIRIDNLPVDAAKNIEILSLEDEELTPIKELGGVKVYQPELLFGQRISYHGSKEGGVWHYKKEYVSADRYASTRIFKVPESGLYVHPLKYQGIDANTGKTDANGDPQKKDIPDADLPGYRVFFWKKDANGGFVPAEENELIPSHIDNATSEGWSGYTKHEAYYKKLPTMSGDLYASIAVNFSGSGSLTPAQKELMMTYYAFTMGSVSENSYGLPAISPAKVSPSNTKPIISFALPTNDLRYFTCYYSTVLLMRDVNYIACSPKYSLLVGVFAKDNTGTLPNFCFSNKYHNVGDYSGVSYVDLTNPGIENQEELLEKCKDGYCRIAVYPNPELEPVVTKGSSGSYTNITYTTKLKDFGILRGYDDVKENVFVGYKNHVHIDHLQLRNPILMDNLHTIRNVLMPNTFAGKYRNHLTSNAWSIPALEHPTLTMYGGQMFANTALINVPINQYVDAVKNPYSRLYLQKRPYGNLTVSMHSYGMACNGFAAAVTGIKEQYLVRHFEAVKESGSIPDSLNQFEIIENWQYERDLLDVKAGDWLLFRKNGYSSPHMTVVSDIVQINGEPFIVELAEAYPPFLRFRQIFLPNMLQKAINKEWSTSEKNYNEFDLIARPKAHIWQYMDEAYPGFTSGNHYEDRDSDEFFISCDRGNGAVYTLKNISLYLTVPGATDQIVVFAKNPANGQTVQLFSISGADVKTTNPMTGEEYTTGEEKPEGLFDNPPKHKLVNILPQLREYFDSTSKAFDINNKLIKFSIQAKSGNTILVDEQDVFCLIGKPEISYSDIDSETVRVKTNMVDNDFALVQGWMRYAAQDGTTVGITYPTNCFQLDEDGKYFVDIPKSYSLRPIDSETGEKVAYNLSFVGAIYDTKEVVDNKQKSHGTITCRYMYRQENPVIYYNSDGDAQIPEEQQDS